MRIGLVLPQIPSYSETFFKNKISGLFHAGHDVFLFVRTASQSTYEGARVIRQMPVLPSYLIQFPITFIILLFFFLRHPIRASRFLGLERSDGRGWVAALQNLYVNVHILSHPVDWLQFGFATMGLKRENVGAILGAKVAVSFRGYDIGIFPLKNPGCYQLLWKKLDKVHTISYDLLAKAHALGLPTGISAHRISPAIDTSKFIVEQRSGLRQPLRIMTIARLHWKKGLEYTLECLSQLLQDCAFEFMYTIVGEGEERERLVFAAHQLGIADRVIFKGRVTHDEIPLLFREHDVYVQYSVQEGFCNSVLEAQAAGMICVVSNAEGLAENIIDGQTGFVVPRRRPRELAAALKRVMNLSVDDQAVIRQNAVARVLQEFDLSHQRDKFIQFYKE